MFGDDAMIEYRVMTEEDKDNVIKLMDEVFFHQEIISKSVNFETPGDTKAYHDAVMPICLESGLSMVALSSSDHQIVGAILNLITTPENPQDVSFSFTDDLTKKLATMDKVYDKVYENLDFFEMYKTSVVVANRGLCVAESHHRRGIGTSLFRRSMDLIRSTGYSCYVVEATSAYTRTMMDRLGFDNVSEKPYTELLVNGQQIVTDTSIHSTLSLHAISL